MKKSLLIVLAMTFSCGWANAWFPNPHEDPSEKLDVPSRADYFDFTVQPNGNGYTIELWEGGRRSFSQSDFALAAADMRLAATRFCKQKGLNGSAHVPGLSAHTVGLYVAEGENLVSKRFPLSCGKK